MASIYDDPNDYIDLGNGPVRTMAGILRAGDPEELSKSLVETCTCSGGIGAIDSKKMEFIKELLKHPSLPEKGIHEALYATAKFKYFAKPHELKALLDSDKVTTEILARAIYISYTTTPTQMKCLIEHNKMGGDVVKAAIDIADKERNDEFIDDFLGWEAIKKHLPNKSLDDTKQFLAKCAL